MESKKTVKKTAKKLGLSQRVAEELAARLLEAWFDGEFEYEMIVSLPSFSYEERGYRRDEMLPFCILERARVTKGGLFDSANTQLSFSAADAFFKPKKIVKALLEKHNKLCLSSKIKLIKYTE